MMKRFFTVILSVVFIALLIPLAVVEIMKNTIDNTKPFESPETAQSIKVYVKQKDEVCDMDIFKYLTGVVAAEMPSDFEKEAMKAQAVAARTYLYAHTYEKASGNESEEHKGAAVCTDSTHCQAWVSEKDFGGTKEAWNKICSAVKETSGEIMTYKKKPISAVFFSTSSGQTENAEDVWGKKIPYIKSVKSEGDELSPRYKSEENISTEDFKKKAEEKLDGIDWEKELFGNIKRSESGGIKTIEIGGKEIKGTELRSIYNLRSTNAALEEKDGNVTFSVKGFGHNVGMSQYGANYMAAQGKDYKKILNRYYTGIKIEILQLLRN